MPGKALLVALPCWLVNWGEPSLVSGMGGQSWAWISECASAGLSLKRPAGHAGAAYALL